MERKTFRDQCGRWCVEGANGTINVHGGDGYVFGKPIDRLAAYEDAIPFADLPRAAELLKADRDGRCVELPCRVGDTVYLTARGIVEETKVRTIFLGHPSYNGGEPDPGIEMVRLTNFDVPIKSFGKTFFLTRAEAEAALGGGEHR